MVFSLYNYVPTFSHQFVNPTTSYLYARQNTITYPMDISSNLKKIIRQKRISAPRVTQGFFLSEKAVSRSHSVNVLLCSGNQKTELLQHGAVRVLETLLPVNWLIRPNDDLLEPVNAVCSLCRQFPGAYLFATLRYDVEGAWLEVLSLPISADPNE